MKRGFLATAAVLAVLCSGQAFAQGVVEISPEQRTVIKRYVVEERVAPIKERVTVGAVLPAEVELHTAPAAWGPWAPRYRYVYSGERVYLVEPSSRRVIEEID